MENIKEPNLDAKEVFAQCGTCSQTFAHILNREFGNPDELVEFALDPLAGGISNQGHQCGMLWGATIAIGAEAYRKYEDKDQALAIAVTAAQEVVDSFINRTDKVNCKEIIGYDLTSVFGMVSFIFKAMMKGMKNTHCFNLAEAWAPEAIDAGIKGLNHEKIKLENAPKSCASEVVKKLGGSEKEALMVSGFAGGLGLSGEACGALAAAIWYQNLRWCRSHPGKKPSMFNNPIAKKLLKSFKKETNSCMECSKIAGCTFNDINDHSEYIKNGGCEKLIDQLVNSI